MKNEKIIELLCEDEYISLNEIYSFLTPEIINKIKNHNERYVIRKSIENKDYFNNLLNQIKLDIEQIRVILSKEKYIQIIAGAGAGKTTVLTAKIKHLIKSKINPKEILIISFTNKAVDELKERLYHELNLNIEVMTFHKLGLKILKDNKVNIKLETKQDSIMQELGIDKNINSKVKNYKNQINENEKYKNHYENYNNYLINNNKLDFDDLIIKSKEYDLSYLNYKYVIVDEYQDISKQRYLLLKKIVDNCNSNLIVVGDDFQAIYGFAGSDIKYFTEFSNYFQNPEILKITSTYRNSQELINIAGKFVMKNKLQIQKKLISKKRLKNPVIIINYKNELRALIYTLNKIAKENSKDILILARYNYDFSLLNNKIFKRVDTTTYMYKNIKLKTLTVHSSKGLGYENVIILKVNKNHFPATKSDTDYHEERRLFYVALTRTKNKVYILTNNKSKFIKEIRLYSKSTYIV